MSFSLRYEFLEGRNLGVFSPHLIYCRSIDHLSVLKAFTPPQDLCPWQSLCLEHCPLPFPDLISLIVQGSVTKSFLQRAFLSIQYKSCLISSTMPFQIMFTNYKHLFIFVVCFLVEIYLLQNFQSLQSLLYDLLEFLIYLVNYFPNFT